MHPNLTTSLTRADEILGDLLAEYEACFRNKTVSPRAIQLTHDICERLRSVLDRTARLYWETHISKSLGEDDRKRAAIYFPIAPHAAGFDSILGRWRWKDVRDQHQPVYDYMFVLQPFNNPANRWLAVVDDLAIASKHIDLVPQTKTEERRTTVSGPGGSVSWGPGVTFGSGVRIMGAPVDPRTQRIIPTAGVVERIEIWVSFLVAEHNVNAAWFCKEACSGTRKFVSEMSEKFKLS